MRKLLRINEAREHVYHFGLELLLLLGQLSRGGEAGRDDGEDFKTSGYLTETLLDPELGHAHAANKAAFNNVYRGNANGLENMATTDPILAG